MTLPLPWTIVLDQPGEIADTQNAYRLLMQTSALGFAEYIAVDTFTRPDSATLTATENGLAWDLQAGAFAVSGLKATSSTTSTVVCDTASVDHDVCSEITITSGAPGLVFRGGPTSQNRLTIQCDLTNSLFNLQKTVAGTTTSIGSATQTFTVGVTYTVRVIMIKDQITCYLDGPGVTLDPITYTLSAGEMTTFSAFTRCGLRNTGTATFDNFRVAVAYASGGGGSSPSYANIPAGSTITVAESGGAYIRPTSRTDVVVVFQGVSNPGAVALENDEWHQTT